MSQKQSMQRNQIQEENQSLNQLIQIYQLGGRYTKNQLLSLNLKDALQSYQVQEHSVRDWAQYVLGYSFCLQKQYGALKQDLFSLHQSMMNKQLFYGEQENKSPIKQIHRKARGPRKEPEQGVLYSRNVIEQLQEQSESSISNPRNIASNDILRLQEEQQPQLTQMEEIPIHYPSEQNSQIHQQVLEDIKQLEQQTFQDILLKRKRASNQESGVSSPQMPLLPRILINDQQLTLFEDIDQSSMSSGTRNIAVMKEFNQLIDIQQSLNEPQQILNIRTKKQLGKIVFDDIRLSDQQEHQYQSNVEALIQTRDIMDDLNNRISLLHFHEEFWKERDQLFQEIEQVQLNLSNLNTDATRSRRNNHFQREPLRSEEQTEQLRQMKVSADDETSIQPFDYQQDEQHQLLDYYKGFDQEQGDIQKLDFINEKDQINAYQRIVFDLKKETDENELTFDEYYSIRIKHDAILRGKAFYDLLVLARLGQLIIKENKFQKDSFSILEISFK